MFDKKLHPIRYRAMRYAVKAVLMFMFLILMCVLAKGVFETVILVIFGLASMLDGALEAENWKCQ